jgi:ATP adenylyltransferase
VTLEHLWAGWRASYIENVANEPPSDDGCLFCRLLDADPEEALVVARNDLVFAVMNAYPYTSGHLMVAPARHEGTLSGLSTEEANALMAMTQEATVALDDVYRPDGANVGVNIGRAAGAGIPGHVHVHVVPRWGGDTNFMTTTANARVLPEPLQVSWEKLRRHWPGAPR